MSSRRVLLPRLFLHLPVSLLIGLGCWLGFMGLVHRSLAQASEQASEQASLQQAYRYVQEQAYDSALVHYRRALAVQAPGSEGHALRQADILQVEAELHYQADELEAAEQKNQRALQLRIAQLGEQDSLVADTYHQQGMILRKRGRLDDALKSYERSISLKKAVLSPNSPRLAQTYNNLINLLRSMGRFEASIAYGREALRINRAQFGELHPEVAKNLHNIGVSYKQLGNYVEALRLYEQSLAIKLAIMDSLHPELAVTYYGMGSLALAKGDPEQALRYTQAARSIWHALKDSSMLGFSQVILGVIYGEKGDHERAIAHNQQALDQQVQKYGTNHPMIAGIITNLAKYSLNAGNHAEAIAYNQQALDIQLDLLGSQHPNVAETYGTRGEILAEQGLFSQALPFFQRALRIMKQATGTSNPEVGARELALARCYALMGRVPEARAHHQRGVRMYEQAGLPQHADLAQSHQNLAEALLDLSRLDEAEGHLRRSFELLEASPLLNPPPMAASPPAIGHVYHQQLLIDGLASWTQLRLKQHLAGKDSALKQAFLTSMMAATLIDTLRLTYQGRMSRLLLAERAQRIFQQGVQAAYELQQRQPAARYLQAAFALIEKSKATWLNEAFNASQALRFADIPPEVLDQARQLRVDMAYFDRQRFEAQQRGDTTATHRWRRQWFHLKQVSDSLTAAIQQQYPTYYQFKYGTQRPQLSEVQAALGPSDLLLDYLLAEDQLYVFCVHQKGVYMRRVALPPRFGEQLLQLRSCLAEFSPTQSPSDSVYAHLGHRWHRLLIEPALSSSLAPEEVEHLLIIPSGELGLIPFEALLTESVNPPLAYHQLPYVLHQHAVSRLYSSQQLFQRSKQPAPRYLAGFAPSYQVQALPMGESSDLFGMLLRDGELALPGAQAEVRRISASMGGDTWTGELASKAAFLQHAPSYRVLHLAMHGMVNHEAPLYSHLVFSPAADSNYQLYASELYDMHLGADMVVLSACNSGYGNLQRGEGIISMAHAFSYAGASSLVMSLWSVADERAGSLMVAFYDLLRQGLPKHQALRHAKLAHLAESDPLYAHPFFWATFVAIGNMEPLSPQPTAWQRGGWAVVAIALFAGVAGGWYLYKKNAAKPRNSSRKQA